MLSVGKCYCPTFTVNGTNIAPTVQSIQIYENICKPYITASAVILDGTNFLNNAQLVGGESVTVTLNYGSSTYTQQFKLLQIHGRQNSLNLRSEAYVMELIGNEFMADRSNLVQQSFKNITVSQAAQNIHSKFLGSTLNVPVATSGLLGQNNSYVVSSRSPIASVLDLIRLASYSAYKTGNPLYFRDAKQCNLVPLEHLVQNISNQGVFVQKTNWGQNAADLLFATNAVLAVEYGDQHDSQTGGGTLNVQTLAKTVNQERKVWDLIPNTLAINSATTQITAGTGLGNPVISLLGSLFSGVTGGHGGSHNYSIHDSTKIPVANARELTTEKLYAAQMKGSGTVTIVVPCQSGFGVTVGKGITANLLKPVGTGSQVQNDPRGGQLLVTDVIHKVDFASSAAMSGTTVIRTVKGGLQQ